MNMVVHESTIKKPTNPICMNSLYNNQKYVEDVRFVAELNLPWECLKSKSIMISGATGMIGSFLVDVIGTRCEN